MQLLLANSKVVQNNFGLIINAVTNPIQKNKMIDVFSKIFVDIGARRIKKGWRNEACAFSLKSYKNILYTIPVMIIFVLIEISFPVLENIYADTSVSTRQYKPNCLSYLPSRSVYRTHCAQEVWYISHGLRRTSVAVVGKIAVAKIRPNVL